MSAVRVPPKYEMYEATAAFPMDHSFVSKWGSDPTTERVRVRWAHFLRMLREDPRFRCCSVYTKRTKTNPAFRPIVDYVTVAKDVSTQHGPRTYKLYEGLANVHLTTAGQSIDPTSIRLTVWRTCDPGRSGLAWTESVCGQDIVDELVQLYATLVPSGANLWPPRGHLCHLTIRRPGSKRIMHGNLQQPEVSPIISRPRANSATIQIF